MSKNHHYVPQFYLRNFASAPQRINVLNADTGFIFQGGPIKGQCYRDHFHGKRENLEQALGNIECKIAPVIKKIISTRRLPLTATRDYERLVMFVALQLTRTSSASSRTSEAFHKTANILQRSNDNSKMNEFEKLRVTDEESVQLNIKTSMHLHLSFLSMSMHLLVNASPIGFITSDNPGFKYNWYCEGTTWQGILGSDRSGYMVFIPLSPDVILVVYDQDVYKFGSRGSESSKISDTNDVNQLNLMQFVNCESVVLFSDWQSKTQLVPLINEARKHRSRPRTSVTEWEDTLSGGRKSIMWHFETCPVLKLDLSVLALKKEARKLPISERLKRYRKGAGGGTAVGPVDPDNPRWRRKI